MRSDNQPQVGTCGISMIAHHDTARPHERKSGCVDWTPLPQPTPAEPRIDWNPKVEEYRKLLMERYSDRCSMDQIANAAYILAGAEPRIETVPEEREAQAEAVNKIWNQFRGGDGEEDCELYRALEQAYGVGRARAGSSLIARRKWAERLVLLVIPRIGHREELEQLATRMEAELKLYEDALASPPSSPGAPQEKSLTKERERLVIDPRKSQ